MSETPNSLKSPCQGTESNRRRTPFQGVALPSELPRHRSNSRNLAYFSRCGRLRHGVIAEYFAHQLYLTGGPFQDPSVTNYQWHQPGVYDSKWQIDLTSPSHQAVIGGMKREVENSEAKLPERVRFVAFTDPHVSVESAPKIVVPARERKDESLVCAGDFSQELNNWDPRARVQGKFRDSISTQGPRRVIHHCRVRSGGGAQPRGTRKEHDGRGVPSPTPGWPGKSAFHADPGRVEYASSP